MRILVLLLVGSSKGDAVENFLKPPNLCDGTDRKVVVVDDNFNPLNSIIVYRNR